MDILLKFSLLYFQRTLETDYLSCHHVSRYARVAHIRQLITENRTFLNQYYLSDYKLDKLGRYLLQKSQFAIYDFLF